MARRVTPKDIELINEVYYQCKNYAKTAEITGWSAATCRKYVSSDYVPAVREHKNFDLKSLSVEETARRLSEEVNITILSKEEKREVEDLWLSLLV